MVLRQLRFYVDITTRNFILNVNCNSNVNLHMKPRSTNHSKLRHQVAAQSADTRPVHFQGVTHRLNRGACNPSLDNMLKTYHGSCHCGAVKYEVDLDLSSRFTARCNCTFCSKLRYWGARAKPEHFRLLSPTSLEDIGLSEYIIHSPQIHNRFCQRCGIYSFIDGWVPEEGEYVYINVACLELTDEELKALKIRYVDGRSDTWATLNKEEVSYL